MDDKKKLIVVGVLVAVVACVGAFQFLGGSKAPAPVAPVEKPKVVPVVDPTKPPEIKNPQVANDLPARDPFNIPFDARPANPMKAGTASHNSPSPMSTHRGKIGDSFKPLSLTGDFNKIPNLPNAGNEAHPEAPVEDKPFGYKIVGTIGGVKPEVMVEDSAGNQKLVPVGSAIDGESRVRGVEHGAVRIDYRGKKLRLTVGGNPGGK